MQLSPSLHAESRSASKYICCLFLKPKNHWRVNNSWPLGHIWTNVYSKHFHILFNIDYILILSFYLRLYLSSGLFPSGLMTKISLNYQHITCLIYMYVYINIYNPIIPSQNIGRLRGVSIWLFLAVCLISLHDFPIPAKLKATENVHTAAMWLNSSSICCHT